MSGDFELVSTPAGIVSLQAVSPRARRWVRANLPGHVDPGGVIVGDRDFIRRTLDGLTAAGLSIRGPERGSDELTLHDSGRTDAELDAIFDELTRGAMFRGDDGLSIALAIGLMDGDCIPMTDRGTVLLTTPRAELDRRVAAIRAALADGATLRQALDQLDGEPTPEV